MFSTTTIITLVLLFCSALVFSKDLKEIEPVQTPLPSTETHEHTCIHDHVQSLTKTSNIQINYSVGLDENQNPIIIDHDKIHLQKRAMPGFKKIRITLETFFDGGDPAACYRTGDVVPLSATSSHTCRSDDRLTVQKRDWLVDELLPEAKRLLEAALLVRPVPKGELRLTRNSADPITCGSGTGAPVAAKYQQGQVDTDLVIFVTARPIATAGVLAFASSCFFDDTTRRPIAGHLNYSPASLTVGAKLLGQIGTTLHEMSHVLGFSSSRFNQFYDAALSEPVPMSDVTLEQGGRTLIQTPRVRSFVRQHFACASALGAELESGGGSGTSGSHWEKRLFQNEFMTGSSSSDPILSNLTLAYFVDSGWYDVDPNAVSGFEMSLVWGRARGCDFLTEKCNSAKGWPSADVWPGYFCDDKLSQLCAFDLRGKARCGISEYPSGAIPADQRYLSNPRLGGLSSLADYCPFYSTVESCVDDAKELGADSLESYGAQSRCFVNSLADLSGATDSLGGSFGRQLGSELQQVSQAMGCYKTYCTSDDADKRTLKILLGSVGYDCPAGEEIDIDGKSGSIKCPPQAQVDAVCRDVPLDNDWPRLDKIEPAAGQPGDTVVLSGANFKSGIAVTIDVPVASVTRDSATKLTVVIAGQENFKDPRHLSLLNSLIEKKTVVVTNPPAKGETEGRTAVLVDAFELTIPLDSNAFLGILDLAERHPMNTAILGIALLLGCLCCVYCCCSGGSGSSQKSRRGDYGGYF